MKLPIPLKIIPFAIVLCVVFFTYHLYVVVAALSSGTIKASKHYFQTQVFRAEDALTFYQILTFNIFGTLAPFWLIYVMVQQWRSHYK